jgi:quercetin dioxygenase-like cupin family protein
MGNQVGIYWRDVPVEDVLAGVTRQTVRGKDCTLVRYTYQPGSVFPAHAHPEEQLTVVHSGRIEFTVGAETLVLGAGMLAVIPGSTPLGARVLGDEPVVSDNYIASSQRSDLRWEA